MRFFARKKDQPRPVSPPRSEYQIDLSSRDYDLLTDCNAALKFWLPETIETKIDRMCSYVNTSASDLIRQILFIHLYGRHDLFGLMERQRPTFNLNRPPEFNLTSDDKGYCGPPPEMNNADVKVWLPAKMKDDLYKLALKENMSLSHYVREVIITHLLGHASKIDNDQLLPPVGTTED